MKRHSHMAAWLAAAAAAAVVAALFLFYRSGQSFRPFETSRALQSNQILFPDSGTSGTQNSGSADDSYWERDDGAAEAGGADTGYLFGQEQPLPDGVTTGGLAQDGVSADNTGNVTGDNIYDIGGPDDNGDIIIPNPAPTPTPTPTPTPGPTPEEPTPGYGSASKDQTNTDYVPPTYGGKNDEHFSGSTQGKLDKNDNYEICFAQSSSANSYGGEALYRGRTGVSVTDIFQSLEAYVWDRTSDVNYYWTLRDLCTGAENEAASYVKITGVSFGYWGGELITEFPLDIPDDEDYLKIYVSYRLSLADEWTPYETEGLFGPEEGVSYELLKGRVVVLDSILKSEGEVIDPSHILNTYAQYFTDWDDSLNLLVYQDKLLGGRGARLTSLFPGWREDGEPVPMLYSVTGGRHVLEPAGRVALSADYQVEINTFWMRSDYTMESGGDGKYTYMQTLTDYLGADKVNDHVTQLTVPQYVQAIEFHYYPGLSVDRLSLPDSVLYVDTNGVPGIDDDLLLYNRGLQVRYGYTVAEGNPRYAARDGLLLSANGAEILGVPTERERLTVGDGITKVVLPYQNKLKMLVLDITSADELPEINYDRLRRSCRIVVPDELVDDYLMAESEMLQRTGLTVAPASQPDQGYALRDDFLLTADSWLHQVLRSNTRWLSLPDYAVGVEADALDEFAGQLSVLLLPRSGSAVSFERGSFDGYAKVTIACWSDQQLRLAYALTEQYPDCVFTIRRVIERTDGYAYLTTDEGTLLCAVPDGIETFDGVIPGLDGGEDIPVTVVNEQVFRGSLSLRWVLLPEHTKAVGYQAFQNCSRLEGVFLDSRDHFLISERAFDNCSLLRFVVSNARLMLLEDDSLTLPSVDSFERYSFLYCPSGDVTGYTADWTDVTDVASFELLPCGGTYVVYGMDSAGTPRVALRAGKTVEGGLTLPATTTVIFREAFENVRTADDGVFSINWQELTELKTIARMAFANSDLGADVTLPENVDVNSAAFSGCEKLASIYLPGRLTSDGGLTTGGLNLGDEVFSSCTALTTVRIGQMAVNAAIFPNVFSGSGLEQLIFESRQPPELLYYSYGFPFYFEYDQEEAGLLHITVPAGSEADYIAAWRCNIMGYAGNEALTAYQALWSSMEWQLYDQLWRDPTPQEVQEVVDGMLLSAENRIRTLLGMEAEDALHRTYTYAVDDIGLISLTATDGVGEWTDLSAATMDMPYGWALDIIGAGAFAGSPSLRGVSLPETLLAVEQDAFAGLTFDSDDPTDGLILYMDSADGVFDLRLAEEGTPFSFGVDWDRISVMSFDVLSGDKDALAAFIQLWTAPMAGWSDAFLLEQQVRTELGEDASEEEVRTAMEAVLLPAENRVRTLLGCEETESLTFAFTLTGGGEELPELPELPDVSDAAMPDHTEEEETME